MMCEMSTTVVRQPMVAVVVVVVLSVLSAFVASAQQRFLSPAHRTPDARRYNDAES